MGFSLGFRGVAGRLSRPQSEEEEEEEEGKHRDRAKPTMSYAELKKRRRDDYGFHLEYRTRWSDNDM